jgi:formylmethanofuran dehydrogenase subunit A
MTPSLTRCQSARVVVRTYGGYGYARMGYAARELDAARYLRVSAGVSSSLSQTPYPPDWCALTSLGDFLFGGLTHRE